MHGTLKFAVGLTYYAQMITCSNRDAAPMSRAYVCILVAQRQCQPLRVHFSGATPISTPYVCILVAQSQCLPPTYAF